MKIREQKLMIFGNNDIARQLNCEKNILGSGMKNKRKNGRH